MTAKFPIELITADAISMFFLTLGALFLLRFALKFGSERVRRYLATMCIFIILFAILHEGLEILHGFFGMRTNIQILILTIMISTIYFIVALALKREMIGITTHGGKENE